MKLRSALQRNRYVLCEGAVIERVRREFSFSLDSYLANAGMVYTPDGKAILEKIYRQYLDIGQKYNLPMIILTPTWRANRENIEKACRQGQDVNGDCFRFLDALRKEYGLYAKKILIGGLVGCKGDAYKPGEALSQDKAFAFHQFQIEALVKSGVDFIIASTLPALSEALGIGQAVAKTGVDSILSFVVRPIGTLLDGTPLSQAISAADSQIEPRPLCYMANCTHPTVLGKALRSQSDSDSVCRRLLGLQANTSAKSPEELDGATVLQTQEPADLAEQMATLHSEFGIKIWGGCCGTDDRHIRAMAEISSQKR